MPYYYLSIFDMTCAAYRAINGVTDDSIMEKNGQLTSMNKKGENTLN
jgi:hypothetical protein